MAGHPKSGGGAVTINGRTVYVHLHDILLRREDLGDDFEVVEEGWAADAPDWDTHEATARFIRGLLRPALAERSPLVICSVALFASPVTAIVYGARQTSLGEPRQQHVLDLARGAVTSDSFVRVLDGPEELIARSDVAVDGLLVHELQIMASEATFDSTRFNALMRVQVQRGRDALRG